MAFPIRTGWHNTHQRLTPSAADGTAGGAKQWQLHWEKWIHKFNSQDMKTIVAFKMSDQVVSGSPVYLRFFSRYLNGWGSDNQPLANLSAGQRDITVSWFTCPTLANSPDTAEVNKVIDPIGFPNKPAWQFDTVISSFDGLITDPNPSIDNRYVPHNVDVTTQYNSVAGGSNWLGFVLSCDVNAQFLIPLLRDTAPSVWTGIWDWWPPASGKDTKAPLDLHTTQLASL